MNTYIEIYEKIENIKPSSLLTLRQKILLKTLGIDTIYDLLYYFPRAYDDRSNIKSIGELRGEEYVVVKAKLMSVTTPPTRSGKKMVKATVSDGTGVMEVIWFGMPYIRKSLKIGEEYIFISQVKRGYYYQMVNPEYKLLNGQIRMQEKEVLPIYSTTKNFTQNSLRSVLKKVLKNYLDLIEENIPTNILEKFKIMDRKKALEEIHFPSSQKNLEAAKRRFAIEEILVLEFGILKDRYKGFLHNKNKYFVEGKKDLVKKYLASYPFSLTNAQKKVITEIYGELNKGIVVNRLIQGDVGSGKTIVAMVMLIYMVENGYQGVIMAPTEILATQHYLDSKKKFEDLGLKVELLTSSIKGKKKEEILKNITSGDIDIVIGTHALIQENVIFKNLGLTIIDEQHRFGVNQRTKLTKKGLLENTVVMSATPIPRSLALTIYGDLDVSIIDELPPGRSPIKTKWINGKENLDKMYDFIEKKIKEDSQAYFVAPLIEESEKMSLESVDKLFENIQARYKNFSVGILHGHMKAKEKEKIMKDFKEKKYQILVATTVIEVGIDVPNATMMTIFNAERFGLSALHQLRGRVGRGSKQSYCFLVSESRGDTSTQRLKIMEETEDGFRIAEEDLKIRNAGEIFGLKQSGFSDLKFIDIIQDLKTINFVRDETIAYLKENDGLINNKYLEIDIDKKFKSKA